MDEFPFDVSIAGDRYARYTRYPEAEFRQASGIVIEPDGSMRLWIANTDERGNAIEVGTEEVWTESTMLVCHVEGGADLIAFGQTGQTGDWNKIATVILNQRWHGPAKFLGFDWAHDWGLVSLPADHLLTIVAYVDMAIDNPYEFSKRAREIYRRDTYRNGKA